MPEEEDHLKEARRPRRILVVDDDEGIRCSLARILKRSGHDVRIGKDGNEAIELAKTFQPELLLIDICMPGIDGVATFRRIRMESPSLATIFMTAYATSDKSLEAEDRGAISVLAKPLDVGHMLELVEMALGTAPVLIADDDLAIRKSISRSIEASGIEVETVATLQQAIRAIRQRPDRAVVADVFLEDGFGYELLDETSGADDPSRFILISGQSQWLTSEVADLIEGRAICLAKPIDLNELIKKFTDND